MTSNPSVAIDPILVQAAGEPDSGGVDGDAGVDELAADGTGCMECGATPRVNRTALCAVHYRAALDRVREEFKRPAKRRSAVPSPKPERPRPPIRKPGLSTDQQARKAQAIDALVAYLAEHPGSYKADLLAAGFSGERVRQAVAAGRIHADGRGPHSNGYRVKNDNSNNNELKAA